MAKKKVEQPIYSEDTLKIPRERFCELLAEQIKRGDELLNFSVPLISQHNSYYGYGSRVQQPKSETKYDDASRKEFIANYNNWNDRNQTIYRTAFISTNNTYLHNYREYLPNLLFVSDDVKAYKDGVSRLISHMRGDIERADLIECDEPSSIETRKSITISKSKNLSNDIFIVHGHSEEMKQSVARVVATLGLNSIILHEQPNEGRTIIEKFESNAGKINFAIILLSADDWAESEELLKKVRKEEIKTYLKKRARQNVVFEMGYFIGRLSRANVFILLQEGVEKPGDLDGIVYTPYDTAGAWNIKLVKELKVAGYDVDANKLF